MFNRQILLLIVCLEKSFKEYKSVINFVGLKLIFLIFFSLCLTLPNLYRQSSWKLGQAITDNKRPNLVEFFKRWLISQHFTNPRHLKKIELRNNITEIFLFFTTHRIFYCSRNFYSPKISIALGFFTALGIFTALKFLQPKDFLQPYVVYCPKILTSLGFFYSPRFFIVL